MIDLYIGGACPGRALAHALPRALICPSLPLDAPPPQDGLGVIAACGSIEDTIAVVSSIAAQTYQPWLAGLFNDKYTTVCNGLLLVRPVPRGLELLMVQPFVQNEGAPMILISACARRAFAFDEKGQIVDVSPPKRSKASAGADRGWAELKRRMKASTLGHSFWPHESKELLFA